MKRNSIYSEYDEYDFELSVIMILSMISIWLTPNTWLYFIFMSLDC